MVLGARTAMWASGKKTPTAADYVQDGLVAMWDGIENAGWGVHDANATTWKDLAGNGFDLSQNLSYDFVSWESDHAVCSSSSGLAALGDHALTSRNTTVEFIGTGATITGNNIGLFSVGILNATLSGIIAYRIAGNQIYTATTTQYASGMGGYELRLSAVLDDGTLRLYADGQLVSTKSVSAGSASESSTVYVLRTPITGWTNGIATNIHCMRLYSRALTASEIAANYAIDAQRFNLSA